MKSRSRRAALLRGALLLGTLLLPDAAPAADAASCLAAEPVPLRVRIGIEPVRLAELAGGGTEALRIIEPATGTTLWSADAGTTAVQRFPAMTATFTSSFIALDTDQDGLHDRIYAGDLDGQLWRFDLHNGAAAAAFASGGVFADFRNAAGRGFHAAPDVSLASAPGATPWFNIALGTAAPGRSDAHNRFYVLRDHSPLQPWTDAQYRDWTPLREADLLQVDTVAGSPRTPAPAGWYIELQQGDVLAASLTVAGRTVFAIADSTTTDSACNVRIDIATLDLAQARVRTDAGGEWRVPVARAQPINARFVLTVDAADAAAATARCSFGDAPLPGCDVDLRPHRTWWRREDAE